jgi:hypothetical protein
VDIIKGNNYLEGKAETKLQNIQCKTTDNSIYCIINRGWLKIIEEKPSVVYKNYSHSSYDMEILKRSKGTFILSKGS